MNKKWIASLACVCLLASSFTAAVAEGMKPPSEPQIWIGGELRPMLPLYTFPTGPPGGD